MSGISRQCLMQTALKCILPAESLTPHSLSQDVGTYCKNPPFTNHPRGSPKVKAAKEGESLKGLGSSWSPVHQEGEESLAAASRCIQTLPRTQSQAASPRRHAPAPALHQSSSSAETDHHHPPTGPRLWQALPNGAWCTATKHCLFVCASPQWWDLPSFMPWALPFTFLCPWPN